MATKSIVVNASLDPTLGGPRDFGASFLMPADGPWMIFELFSTFISGTPGADEGISGYMTVESLEGGILPDPAPARYPIISSPSAGTTVDHQPIVALTRTPVLWDAAGKAELKFRTFLSDTITAPTFGQIGILFGKEIPAFRPRIFSNGIEYEATSADEELAGTITLSERAKRIVAIMPHLNLSGAISSADARMGQIRLDSDDIELTPLTLPCDFAFPAGDATGQAVPSVYPQPWFDVDIPVREGARINVFTKATSTQHADMIFQTFLAYE